MLSNILRDQHPKSLHMCPTHLAPQAAAAVSQIDHSRMILPGKTGKSHRREYWPARIVNKKIQNREGYLDASNAHATILHAIRQHQARRMVESIQHVSVHMPGEVLVKLTGLCCLPPVNNQKKSR